MRGGRKIEKQVFSLWKETRGGKTRGTGIEVFRNVDLQCHILWHLIGVESTFIKIRISCALPTTAPLSMCRSARGSGTETLGFTSLSVLFKLSDCIHQETTLAGYCRIYQIVVINLFWSNEFRLGRLSLHLSVWHREWQWESDWDFKVRVPEKGAGIKSEKEIRKS